MADWDYYLKVKRRYRDERVVRVYDEKRFGSWKGRVRSRGLVAAVERAFEAARASGHPIASVLDIPCGTGRLFPTLIANGIRFVGADISYEMMQRAAEKFPPTGANTAPFVQCDAERMPFKDGSFDAVTCIRFLTIQLPHDVRVRIFKEMNRVSRAFVLLECRHKANFSYLWRWLCAKLRLRPPPVNYFSRNDIEQELNEAGIQLVQTFCTLGFFSDKWVVLGRTKHNS